MIKKSLNVVLVVAFLLTSMVPIPKARAEELGLPLPGTMINLSPAYEPVMIKGLTVHKDNPFLFDFIVDVGDSGLSVGAGYAQPLRQEGEKLIKYFLAALAIPEKDLWVNLSPYEKDRTIPEELSKTDMGRDLLTQDYILKQITASLIYPEKALGKAFWDKVYTKAQQLYGTTEVPVNTFNKVWIMADRAEVFEHNNTAFVTDSHLKVMLEEDYLALQKSSVGAGSPGPNKGGETPPLQSNDAHGMASDIVRQIILPELEKEVNTGKNFANLRQIFNSLILASWYKKNLKEALLNQVYSNQSHIKGIDLQDKTIKEQIYQQYLQAYKKGVFNYIKEDIDKAKGTTIPRKYFSGGMQIAPHDLAMTTDPQKLAHAFRDNTSIVDITAGLDLNKISVAPDRAMASFSDDSSAAQEKWKVGEMQRLLKERLIKELESIADHPADHEGHIAATFNEVLDYKTADPQLIIDDERVIQKLFGVPGIQSYLKNLIEHGVFSRKALDAVQGTGATDRAMTTGMTDIEAERMAVRIKQSMRFVERTMKSADRIVQRYSTNKSRLTPQSTQSLQEARAILELYLDIWKVDLERLETVITGSSRTDHRTIASGLRADIRQARSLIKGIGSLLPRESAAAPDRAMAGDAETKSQIYRILFVDDFKEYADGVSSELRRIGYEVDTAYSGAEALKKYSPRKYSVVIIDWNIGDMKGRELINNLRRVESEHGSAPVPVVINSSDRMAFHEQALAVITSGGTTEIKSTLEQYKASGAILPVDAAMRVSDEKGGIDLNTNGMNWSIRKDGTGVEMNIDPAMIERIKREGIDSLTPVIFRITPVVNVWALIGLEPPKKQEERLAGV